MHLNIKAVAAPTPLGVVYNLYDHGSTLIPPVNNNTSCYIYTSMTNLLADRYFWGIIGFINFTGGIGKHWSDHKTPSNSGTSTEDGLQIAHVTSLILYL